MTLKKKPAGSSSDIGHDKGKKNSARRETMPLGERTTVGFESKQQEKESSGSDGEEVGPLEIEEKMIYSDYSKNREEMGEGKFDAIKGKIADYLSKATLESLI